MQERTLEKMLQLYEDLPKHPDGRVNKDKLKKGQKHFGIADRPITIVDTLSCTITHKVV